MRKRKHTHRHTNARLVMEYDAANLQFSSVLLLEIWPADTHLRHVQETKTVRTIETIVKYKRWCVYKQ